MTPERIERLALKCYDIGYHDQGSDELVALLKPAIRLACAEARLEEAQWWQVGSRNRLPVGQAMGEIASSLPYVGRELGCLTARGERMSEHIPYNWDDEDMCFMDEDEEEEETIRCRLCSCIIGEEVSFADDWGDGPICDNCLRTGEVSE